MSRWPRDRAPDTLPRARPFGQELELAQSRPLRNLEREERPKIEGHELRILSSTEIGALLGKAPSNYQVLLATALLTGARQAEIPTTPS